MAKIHEINHAVQGVSNAVSGIVFNADDGFRVLVIFFDLFFHGNGIAAPTNKNGVNGNGVDSFFEKRGLAFGFDGDQSDDFVFGQIRKIAPFRLTGNKKDYIIVGSDSGRIVILEANLEKREFVKIHQETFGKTIHQCFRI